MRISYAIVNLKLTSRSENIIEENDYAIKIQCEEALHRIGGDCFDHCTGYRVIYKHDNGLTAGHQYALCGSYHYISGCKPFPGGGSGQQACGAGDGHSQ